VALLSIALALPSLDAGLALDDFAQQLFVKRKVAGQLPDQPWWDMFLLIPDDPDVLAAGRSSGFFPWWAVDELRIRFLRPVSVATHYLDEALWPESWRARHAQSILLYGLLCACVSLLFLRIGGRGLAIVIASVMFAVDHTHLSSFAWLANRYAIISTLFGVLCILAHDRWRREGWKPGLFLSPLLLITALLSGEIGISTVAFLVAHLVFLDRGTWRARASVLTVYLVTLLAWQLGYGALGYGSYGSGAYLDPVANPVSFLQEMPYRILVLLGLQAGPPAPLLRSLGLLNAVSELPIWFVLGMMTLPFVFWAGLRAHQRNDGTLLFWLTSCLLSLIPLSASTPGERLLVFTSVGASALLGRLVSVLLPERPHGRGPSIAVVSIALIVSISHLPVSAAVVWWECLQASNVARTHNQNRTPRVSVEFRDEKALSQQEVIVLNTPSYLHAGRIVRAIVSERRGLPRSFGVLGTSTEPVTVNRVDKQTLVLTTPAGYLLEPFSAFYRGPQFPLRQGTRIRVRAYEVEVLETIGWRPKTVRFRFDAPLDQGILRFLTWNGESYQETGLPSPGSSIRVPGLDALPGVDGETSIFLD
jgi:hypothetical protein